MEHRRLILMRHATAATGTGRDFDRPLTRRGLEEAQRVGERLRSQGPRPDRVITSSARRCVETWQAVARGLGGAPDPGRATGPIVEPLVEHDDRLYNASTRGLLAAIRAVDDAQTLLVLAHNPGISVLALELGRAHPADEIALRDGFAPASTAIFGVAGAWCDLAAASTRLLRFDPAPREGDGD
ncbi:MAG: histidine phosphatase family protein [Deltaproteobacteria bacterium]|nr:histidine phosphatase family protein [Deltaproteobacteria bacterium]